MQEYQIKQSPPLNCRQPPTPHEIHARVSTNHVQASRLLQQLFLRNHQSPQWICRLLRSHCLYFLWLPVWIPSCTTLFSNIVLADLSCSKSCFIWMNCSSILLVKLFSNADMPMLISSRMTALNVAIVAADIFTLEIGSWTSVGKARGIKSEAWAFVRP